MIWCTALADLLRTPRALAELPPLVSEAVGRADLRTRDPLLARPGRGVRS